MQAVTRSGILAVVLLAMACATSKQDVADATAPESEVTLRIKNDTGVPFAMGVSWAGSPVFHLGTVLRDGTSVFQLTPESAGHMRLVVDLYDDAIPAMAISNPLRPKPGQSFDVRVDTWWNIQITETGQTERAP